MTGHKRQRSRYQKITLDGKTHGGRGKDRSPEYETIFPFSAKGMSILDLGCNAGFYCLRAASEGARRVVGVDSDHILLRNAKKIAKEHDLDVEFVHGDMRTIELDGVFDTILCLNVLHYFNSIEEVDIFLARIMKWSPRTIAFVLAVPSKGQDFVMTIHSTKKIPHRLAIWPEHIERAFPGYLAVIMDSRIRPRDRKLVMLKKNWLQDMNWL